MKAISVRQPWAWLILNAGKDIDNRKWRTWQRGRVLVHASLSMPRSEYAACQSFCDGRVELPAPGALQKGGIVGSVEITGCVSRSASDWFEGPFGFVLANPERLPFVPLKGALQFFTVPSELAAEVTI